MAALATIQDFTARHGAPDDESVVGALLEDASALIRAEAAGTDADWVAEDPDEDVTVPAAIRAICVQIAYRAWANPDGVAREELGEASRTLRGTDQADVLWLTKNEARIVRKAAGTPAIRSIAIETPYSGGTTETHPMDFYPDGLDPDEGS